MLKFEVLRITKRLPPYLISEYENLRDRVYRRFATRNGGALREICDAS
jgi:hypothetical protein